MKEGKHKKARMGAHPQKYKANKSTKTQPCKEHNNRDTTNTEIK